MSTHLEVHQAGEGDHGGIVGGEAWRTGKKLKPVFPAGRGQPGAEGAVAAHSASLGSALLYSVHVILCKPLTPISLR